MPIRLCGQRRTARQPVVIPAGAIESAPDHCKIFRRSKGSLGLSRHSCRHHPEVERSAKKTGASDNKCLSMNANSLVRGNGGLHDSPSVIPAGAIESAPDHCKIFRRSKKISGCRRHTCRGHPAAGCTKKDPQECSSLSVKVDFPAQVNRRHATFLSVRNCDFSIGEKQP
jgi:hypothetical protein